MIELERELPASPAAVWPLLTEPEQMNRWSRARVTPLLAGDGGFGAVGALRRVLVPGVLGRSLALEEVVQIADAPARFVYRVVAPSYVQGHRGEMTLEPTPRGSRLRWTVSFTMPGHSLAERLLRPDLHASLDALVREAAAVAGVASSLAAPAPWEPEPLEALYREASDCLEEQRALARSLTAAGDPNQWFIRVYQYVTEGQLEACRSGALVHVGWILRLVLSFHRYYWNSITAPDAAEAHWRSSFRAARKALEWKRDPFAAVLYAIAKGMQAHIEEDLPRALAEVWVRHYASRCAYARLRADYLLMGPLLAQAAERLTAEIPRSSWPLRARLAALLPDPVQASWRERRFYDLARQRRRAFERGERLARLVVSLV